MRAPKPVRSFAKFVLREAAKFRLSRLPLTLRAADIWVERIKKWPAIFRDDDFVVTKTVGCGVRLELGFLDVIQRTLRIDGEWEPHVLRAIRHFLKEGGTFLDVGANIGYFSLAAAKIVGESGRVVSVEPSVRALGKLVKNINLNSCGNLILLSVGAGDKDGIGSLYQATPTNIGGSSMVEGSPSIKTETIAIARLDPILKYLGVKPDLIKIDVEGYEPNVIRGLTETIVEHRPVIISEVIHSILARAGTTPGRLISMLKEFGYDAHILDPAQPVFEPRPIENYRPFPESADVLFIPGGR